MKKALTHLLLVAVFAMLLTTSIFASNNAFSFIIDNNTTDANYGNMNVGFTYYSDSSCYNGDAQKVATMYSHSMYGWTGIDYHATSPINVSFGIYISSTGSLDGAAEYYIGESSNTDDMYVLATINQNIYKDGWSFFSYIYSESGTTFDGSYDIYDISVIPSGVSDGTNYTIADAVYMHLST